MKTITIISILILLSCSTVFAHGAPEFPTPGKCIYEGRSDFTCLPAIAGGAVVAIPFTVVGGVIGLVFLQPKAGIFFGMILGNVTGNLIIGGPFYLIERTVIWDWNKDDEFHEWNPETDEWPKE